MKHTTLIGFILLASLCNGSLSATAATAITATESCTIQLEGGSLHGDYLPASYQVYEMLAGYRGEEEGRSVLFIEKHRILNHRVQYIRTDAERETYRLYLEHGRAYKLDVNGQKVPYSPAEGRANFVMDALGRFYVKEDFESDRGRFHHSSFFAGQPIAGCGVMRIVNGSIYEVLPKFRHYPKEKNLIAQPLEELRKNGFDTDFMTFSYPR